MKKKSFEKFEFRTKIKKKNRENFQSNFFFENFEKRLKFPQKLFA